MNYQIHTGDALQVLKTLPDESVNCIVTSPPYYGLRDYGVDGQIGLEETPEQFIEKLTAVFHEAKRVLRSDGTLWVNMGDSYAGSGKGMNADGSRNIQSKLQQTNAGSFKGGLTSKYQTDQIKPKDLIGIPWMLAFSLRADGWYLRQDIIWHKPNVMPESVTDRCTKCHEYIFLLSKSREYYYDAGSIAEPCKEEYESRYKYPLYNEKSNIRPTGHQNTFGMKEWHDKRNKRDVWTVTNNPYKGAHFATYPEDLIVPCILAGCPRGGVVLDPFNGSGTTGVVAVKNERNYIGIELNPAYVEMAEERLYEATAQQKIDFGG